MSPSIQLSSHERAVVEAGRICDLYMPLKASSCTVGWPSAIATQPDTRAMKRHGRRCEVKNKIQVATKRKRKMVEESGSLEKLVGGARAAIRASCTVEKSSMMFCRSRMFRKKSFDISGAGRTERAGAKGGPDIEY